MKLLPLVRYGQGIMNRIMIKKRITALLLFLGFILLYFILDVYFSGRLVESLQSEYINIAYYDSLNNHVRLKYEPKGIDKIWALKRPQSQVRLELDDGRKFEINGSEENKVYPSLNRTIFQRRKLIKHKNSDVLYVISHTDTFTFALRFK